MTFSFSWHDHGLDDILPMLGTDTDPDELAAWAARHRKRGNRSPDAMAASIQSLHEANATDSQEAKAALWRKAREHAEQAETLAANDTLTLRPIASEFARVVREMCERAGL